MNKTILAILVGAFLISGALYLTSPKEGLQVNEEEVVEEEAENEENEENEKSEGNEEIISLVDCLKEKGVVIYGSRTCPACAQLAEGFGGYDVIEKIYVECAEEGNRCGTEKLTGFVPEIQIKGELYEKGRTPSSLAEATGCEF